MTEEKVPWYRRSLLPAWIPTWLAVAVLIGLGFGIAFGVFLQSPNPWVVTAVATVFGFGIALVVLSMASVRYQGPGPNPIAPPDWLRFPLLTALLVSTPVFWMENERGDVGTEVLGIGMLLLIVAGFVLGLINQRRRLGVLPAMGVVCLTLAMAGLGIGVMLVIGHHAG